jgi:hypothetical protein
VGLAVPAQRHCCSCFTSLQPYHALIRGTLACHDAAPAAPILAIPLLLQARPHRAQHPAQANNNHHMLVPAAGNKQLTSLTLGGIGGRYDSSPQWNEATAGLRLALLGRLTSLERLHLGNCGCALTHRTALEALGQLRALALPRCCLLLAGGTPRLQLLKRLAELSLKHCEWLLVEQQLVPVPAATTAAQAALPAPAAAAAAPAEAQAVAGAAAGPAAPAAGQPLVMDEAGVERWAAAASSQVLLLPGSITDLQLEGFVGPEPQTSRLAAVTRLQPMSADHSLRGMAAALQQHAAAYAALQELRLTGPQQEELAVLRRLPALTCLHCLELSGRPQELMDFGALQGNTQQCLLSWASCIALICHRRCTAGMDLLAWWAQQGGGGCTAACTC